MASPFRMSLTNWLAQSGVVVTADTSASNYPASYILEPQYRDLPHRTTAVSQQAIVIDLGSARLCEMFSLVGLNYTSVTIQMHTSNSWGAPDFTVALAAGLNPWNEHYALVHYPASPPTKRWLRYLIAAQTPVDGASFFATGGGWAGPLTTVPSGLRWDEIIETIEPKEFSMTLSMRTQKAVYGDVLNKISYRRLASVNFASPGTGDDLASWRSVDRLMRQADFFAWSLDYGNTSEAWIMRRLNDPKWPIDASVSEDDFVLEEMV